jgi:hypothetical protein
MMIVLSLSSSWLVSIEGIVPGGVADILGKSECWGRKSESWALQVAE